MENLGGYIEDAEENNRRYLSPEAWFDIELARAFDFLSRFVDQAEFEIIRNNVRKFPNYLFKNPYLILMGFIAFKERDVRSVTRNSVLSPVIASNNIRVYDIIRYTRFFDANFKRSDFGYR
ncbi:hypothetical protein AV955_gp072 [Diadromus pulchellus ascovirus 4a]|uniref:Complete DpAV4 genome n=1 Tax=Diadromus pulchellus ascovirus 4a TaxID=158683 RepID=F2NZ01_9VIRU|nr:hypothetical protein AV955_gp072 [Diadromus pulchellus ascovirus 4a]CCA61429.1 unnamed protein product [Diadromus pulchellus ascovirus 4a]